MMPARHILKLVVHSDKPSKTLTHYWLTDSVHLGFNFLTLHFEFHISFSCPVEHLQLMHNEDDDDNEGNTSQNDL